MNQVGNGILNCFGRMEILVRSGIFWTEKNWRKFWTCYTVYSISYTVALKIIIEKINSEKIFWKYDVNIESFQLQMYIIKIVCLVFLPFTSKSSKLCAIFQGENWGILKKLLQVPLWRNRVQEICRTAGRADSTRSRP